MNIVQIQYKYSVIVIQYNYSDIQYKYSDIRTRVLTTSNKYRNKPAERCGSVRSGAERNGAEQCEAVTGLHGVGTGAELRISGEPSASCRLDRSVQLGCGAHIVGPKAPVSNQVM